MTVTDTVLDRIKKLLAHADSAKSIGSQAEAEAFAAKAASIALEHKLELGEIEFAAEVDANPIGEELVNTADLKGDTPTRKRSAWQQSLLSTLARNNSCLITVMIGSKSCYLIGTPSDREIVKYLYTVLAKEGERLARKSGYNRRDFLLGFVRGIGEKLHAQRTAQLEEAGQFALVRVQNHDKAVGAWMYANMQLGGSVGLTGARDGAGYAAGRAAGQRANVNGGLGGGTAARASSMRLTA